MPARNNGAKIIISTSFATSCLAVLQIIISASPTTKVDAKTCIEVEESNFICSDEKNELAEARKRARKNVQYYLNNFGVRQTIDGNAEENEQMLKVANAMEDYLKSWISRYDNVEEMKEKWYVTIALTYLYWIPFFSLTLPSCILHILSLIQYQST